MTPIEKLEARVKDYQAKEAECIQQINSLNENRLRLSGAILGLGDQIADLQAEDEEGIGADGTATVPEDAPPGPDLAHRD